METTALERRRCHIGQTGQQFLFPGAHSALEGGAAVSLGQVGFGRRAGHPEGQSGREAGDRAGGTSRGVSSASGACAVSLPAVQTSFTFKDGAVLQRFDLNITRKKYIFLKTHLFSSSYFNSHGDFHSEEHVIVCGRDMREGAGLPWGPLPPQLPLRLLQAALLLSSPPDPHLLSRGHQRPALWVSPGAPL